MNFKIPKLLFILIELNDIPLHSKEILLINYFFINDDNFLKY